LEFEQENQKIEAEKSKVEVDKLAFLKQKKEQELRKENDRQAHELLKIKAQQDHELALEQQKAAVAKARREYDAAAEATKQAHELQVLREKKDYERMQIEQKKLQLEMADTVRQRSRHTSAENGGWMESGVKPKPFKGPKMPCFEESKNNMDAFCTDSRSTQKLNVGEEISGQCIYQLC